VRDQVLHPYKQLVQL